MLNTHSLRRTAQGSYPSPKAKVLHSQAVALGPWFSLTRDKADWSKAFPDDLEQEYSFGLTPTPALSAVLYHHIEKCHLPLFFLY